MKNNASPETTGTRAHRPLTSAARYLANFLRYCASRIYVLPPHVCRVWSRVSLTIGSSHVLFNYFQWLIMVVREYCGISKGKNKTYETGSVIEKPIIILMTVYKFNMDTINVTGGEIASANFRSGETSQTPRWDHYVIRE